MRESEWQKPNLPHMHIIYTSLRNEDLLRKSERLPNNYILVQIRHKR